MRPRFAFPLLFFLAAVLAANSTAQQITNDVVIQGASVNDGYGDWLTCGVDGQVYRHPGGHLTSVMRVSPDGSTLLFRLPEQVYPREIAPAGTGLSILGPSSKGERSVHVQMYHFDNQANLMAQSQVTIPIQPTSMAVLPSGRTILAGLSHDDPQIQDEWKYGFAILDENDKLLRSIDLPLPPGGGGWTFASSRMAVGNGVAYVMLHSNEPPQTAIATISEAGDLGIKVIAAPLDTETRHHNEWVFGPGVAVDLYIYRNERPHVTTRFDEYDLKTDEKIATKTASATGFQFGCYMGDEFSMLAHSAHVDPARHLSWDTLRLVTSKLK